MSFDSIICHFGVVFLVFDEYFPVSKDLAIYDKDKGRVSQENKCVVIAGAWSHSLDIVVMLLNWLWVNYRCYIQVKTVMKFAEPLSLIICVGKGESWQIHLSWCTVIHAVAWQPRISIRSIVSGRKNIIKHVFMFLSGQCRWVEFFLHEEFHHSHICVCFKLKLSWFSISIQWQPLITLKHITNKALCYLKTSVWLRIRIRINFILHRF